MFLIMTYGLRIYMNEDDLSWCINGKKYAAIMQKESLFLIIDSV